MLNSKYKTIFNQIFEPAGRVCVVLGLTPNQLTLIGLFLGILVCFIYVWTGNGLLFAILILLCGMFDVLDGAVARLTGKVTKFGAYLDAVCDRLLEGFGGIAVSYVTGYWLIMFFMMIGMVVFSYAKARTAIEVPISNLEWPDLMERGERAAVFLLGLIISEVTHLQIAGRPLFYWVIIGLTIAIYASIVQRVLRAKRYIEERS